MPITYAADFTLKIDGEDAPKAVRESLQQLVIEESLHLPSVFTLMISNPDQPGREGQEIFKYGGYGYADLLAIGKRVEIELSRSTTGSTEFEDAKTAKIFGGEITGTETHFDEGSQATIVVRGYDVSHRLHRGRHNRSFQNMTDDDIVKEIAGADGVATHTVDSTGGPYGYGDINEANGYTFQHNQTNMAFLRMLANRNGFECFVQDDKLYFRRPASKKTLELKWKETLSSFSVRVSSAEQVKEVEVRGWDYKQKRVISETITTGQVLTTNSYGKGSKTSQSFKGKPSNPKMLIVDQHFAESSQARKIAQSVCNELSGEFVQADARAEGNPEIRPGRLVKLENLGPHSGEYYVTETRHLFQAGLYTTEFSVRGLRNGDLFTLLAASGAERETAHLMVGIVTDNKDPKDWGRVRVKLPALTEEHASYWARVVGAGAGPNRGFDCLPEINDEVLVGFEQGDIHRPYVIGGVWNGTDAPPEKTAESTQSGKVRLRTFKTRLGHKLQFVEEDKGSSKQGVYVLTKKGHQLDINDSDQFVHIKTAGNHEVKLDDQNKKLLVKTNGGQKLEMVDTGNKITLSAGATIEISAPQGITLSAGPSTVEIKPGGITIKSPATVVVDGSTTTVKGTGKLTLQGGLITIN
ncbi:VgrG-related protein [Leptolyngbya sp. PCC 6406]|uniref:VgrG-related protein n=1 Tax=Leptolyngbya sp. PCC 6406 TaxID=1173264 RepID=UPI0002ABA8B1|nr:VgrG-related protein [Leptolyngbya sp. PCC 6406]